ncbi:unnamed protein product [Pelagomonas calceolata]|uniref:Uncharacterized protein n=1 Tax=Pelagomonas calceolata TaxID=35677 RepID=A0A7S4ED31_9STRA|nr:unnamed protein product [Pelagomonas calceolata]|mmetsp:Transcript_12709/g.37821  ORF Transcript_12709/g.37821 Transcript_12709/m.37821 type:complete len:766 (+) Transcript_12709:96-2393(+)
MGLGPRGDGRAGRRRAGPMMTAMLFGSLILGAWRRGPPSASAGPPRALRGDVCGDARARAADAVSDVCRTGSQSRWASSLPLGLRPSTRRGHCVMSTMKPRNMKPGELEGAGEYGDKILKTDFANLPGKDQMKCFDEALRRAVQKKMKWPHPPSGEVLFAAVRKHRERANAPAAKPKGRRAPGPPIPSQPPRKRRSKPPPAKPAALAQQNLNTSESAIVAVAPQTPLVDAANYALRALAGESEDVANASQIVEVKKDGGEWKKFTSKSKAVQKIRGLTTYVLDDLLEGKASDMFEARRLVSNKRPISKLQAFTWAADALGLRHDISKATALGDLDACVLELVDHVVLPDSVKVRPPSWEALLKYVKSLSSRDQRVLVEKTRRAENERVLKLREAGCDLGREAQRELRREEAEEGRLRDVEALRDLLLLGYNLLDDKTTQRAFEGEVKVSYLPSHVVDDRRPVYVKYKGDHRVELKAGPWPDRYAWGDGVLELGSAGGADNPYGPRETLVATISRQAPGDFAWFDCDGACGDRRLLHRGQRGRVAVTLTPRQPAGAYVRQRPFSSLEQMQKLGFRLVEEEAATTASGETIEGFGRCSFTFHVDEDGPDQMPALREEFLRFRGDLLGVTLKDKRLAEGVYASTRRTQNGATDAPQVVSFMFSVPCRATGATPRTERALQHLKDQGYPLMATLDHRCILNSVAFEFLAYRDPSVGGKWHVDRAKDLLLSALQMKSVTMKEDANLKRSKQHFTREDVAQMEECSDDSVI